MLGCADTKGLLDIEIYFNFKMWKLNQHLYLPLEGMFP